MAREINRLHTRQVPNLTDPGLHADGGGLYLRVNPGNNEKPGSRQWVLIYNFKGKRREMGLGGLTKEFGLVEARKEASAQRRLLVEGKDPLAEKEAKAKAEAEARAAAEAAAAFDIRDRGEL